MPTITHDPVQRGKAALAAISQNDGDAVDHWLSYGGALNDLRAEHASNEAFGKEVEKHGLNYLPGVPAKLAETKVHDHDRAAAMWAAAYPDQLKKARVVGKKVRTVRGWHAAWKRLVAKTVKNYDLADAVGDEDQRGEFVITSNETGIPVEDLMEAAAEAAKKADAIAAKAEAAAAAEPAQNRVSEMEADELADFFFETVLSQRGDARAVLSRLADRLSATEPEPKPKPKRKAPAAPPIIAAVGHLQHLRDQLPA